jgi:hypothetical protein
MLKIQIKMPTATETKMFHIKEIHILKSDWRQLEMCIIFLLEKLAPHFPFTSSTHTGPHRSGRVGTQQRYNITNENIL